MATNRVIYNNELLFVGPAPASGYFFSDPNGNLLRTGVYNLIQPLKRINQFSYQINTQSSRFSEIGNASTIYDYTLNPPDISLSFNYNIKDLRNEARMGFYVNLGPPNLDQFDGGQVFPSGNLLSGFSFGDQNYSFNSDLTQATNNTFKYPFKYRDQRNLFLTITPNNTDAIGNSISGFPVLAFGNCYITSYGVQAQVNDFPKATVNYAAHNVLYYSSGINVVSPYLEPKSGTLNTGITFNIPTYNTAFEETGNAISVSLGTAELDANTLVDATSVSATTTINSVSIIVDVAPNITGIQMTTSTGTVFISAWAVVDIGITNNWSVVDIAA